MTVKVDILGHGWCAQMSGQWGNVCHWKDNLRNRIQAISGFIDVDLMGRLIRDSAEYFAASAFSDVGHRYDLLLSGFQDGTPKILTVSLEIQQRRSNKVPCLSLVPSDTFSCIGSGSLVANALLTARECNPSMPVEYVTYLAYESKRISEKTGTIGNLTALAIHAPGQEDSADKASLAIMNPLGDAQLKVYVSGVWKVPLVDFPQLNPEWFGDGPEIRAKVAKLLGQPSPQVPIADPLPQPPSQESPEGSGES